jgi:hypothetical protein
MTLTQAIKDVQEFAKNNYRQFLPCGFSYLSVRNLRGKKLEALKSIGFSKDSYNGGYVLSLSKFTYSQDMNFKEELGYMLREKILEIYPELELTVWSRID